MAYYYDRRGDLFYYRVRLAGKNGDYALFD